VIATGFVRDKFTVQQSFYQSEIENTPEIQSKIYLAEVRRRDADSERASCCCWDMKARSFTSAFLKEVSSPSWSSLASLRSAAAFLLMSASLIKLKYPSFHFPSIACTRPED